MLYVEFNEAMHLLPQSFVVTGSSLLLPEAPVGSAALLLPVADRFFLKSLPHLLPRQAFLVLATRLPDDLPALSNSHHLSQGFPWSLLRTGTDGRSVAGSPNWFSAQDAADEIFSTGRFEFIAWHPDPDIELCL
jgi:hypothetical protein